MIFLFCFQPSQSSRNMQSTTVAPPRGKRLVSCRTRERHLLDVSQPPATGIVIRSQLRKRDSRGSRFMDYVLLIFSLFCARGMAGGRRWGRSTPPPPPHFGENITDFFPTAWVDHMAPFVHPYIENDTPIFSKVWISTGGSPVGTSRGRRK